MLGPLLRGHLLLFDRRQEPVLRAQAGAGLLVAAVLLELLRVLMTKWLLGPIPLLPFMVLLLAAAVAAPRLTAGLQLRDIGLRPWRDWSFTEKAYLIQVVLLANVVFCLVLRRGLSERLAQDGASGAFFGLFLPYLLYGFYQELVYRGMFQRELTRRWGAIAGVLVANVLYTFGPLHAGYLVARPSLAVPMLAAIFVMGLFFGLVFLRSGNLWLPATFHAIGNAYVVTAMGEIIR